jgi:hypothetical protein
MNPADLPCARELFAQWQRARGGRTDQALHPFSRNWEDLLEDARLVSATERSEAERDARALEIGGWVQLKPVQYRPHLIDRVIIPLPAETRWRDAFGFVPPSDEEARLIREFSWEPELAFLRQAKVNLPFAELCQLNQFLKDRPPAMEIVPIKERSLQIFGDEKRLDVLLTSSLFRPDRLELGKHLGCEIIGVPLAWKRGPAKAAAQPIIIIENAATWHSYCRWNSERAFFSAVVYGDGNRVVDGIRYLADIFDELGGQRRIFYFGDLDPQGVLIPQEASGRGQAMGLPLFEPHAWSYRELLRLGAGRGQPYECEPPSSTLCDWLGENAEPARLLFASGKRLAQELASWDFLRSASPDPISCPGNYF